MVGPNIKFLIFVTVSLVAFIGILAFVLKGRETKVNIGIVILISLIVVVGGMLFAKVGNNVGWPWWIYYTMPASITLFLPPLSFKMKFREVWQYLVLAFLSSPTIHTVFSFFLGWNEYMPFIKIPYIMNLIG